MICSTMIWGGVLRKALPVCLLACFVVSQEIANINPLDGDLNEESNYNETSSQYERPEIIEEPNQEELLFLHTAETYPFSESLEITLLPKNHLLSSFDFSLSSERIDRSKEHKYTNYKSFPRSLAPILESTNTRELHLRFGQGWWDAEQWGQLPGFGQNSGGVGVEIWAVIEANNKEAALQQWNSLVNSLSGLFCASLNFIDNSKTIYPVNFFNSSQNFTIFDEDNKLFLLRSALASEPVCTENLTPFLKFLPTRGKSGLSSLLDGHRIYDSLWHMMAIDIQTECEGTLCKYNMKQKIDAVSNINRSLLKKIDPIPKPLSGDQLKCDTSKPHDAFQCFPIEHNDKLRFTLSDIFGRSISGPSLISKTPSKVCVKATSDWDIFLRIGEDHYGTGSNCFEINEKKEHDVYFSTENGSNVPGLNQVPVFASRSLTGYAQDKGLSRTVFRNPTNEYVKLLYLESLPWFMRVYLHSLEITGAFKENVVQSIYYSPESDRKRPSHIEFELIIPPNSEVTLSYTFDKSLLLYAEYPPDANHGFSVEPAVVSVIEPFDYQFRTSASLLTLPTPDFSMPYNVIILTSTIMSLSFGTIFNLLAKRIVTEEEAELVGAVGLLGTILVARQKLKDRIAFLKTRLLSKLSFKNDSSSEEKKIN